MRSGIALLVIVCCLTADVRSWRPFVIHLNKTECFWNPNILNLTECAIREINSVPTIFLDVILLQDVCNFTYGLKVIIHREQADLVLFNAEQMDGCVFLANTENFPLLKIIRKELQKYSNLPYKCPVKTGTSINVRGLKIDPENFPTYAPEATFSSIGYLHTDTTYLFNMTVTGIFEAKRKFFKGIG